MAEGFRLIFTLLLNSALIFLSSAVLIEIALFIVRPGYRLRYFCRMVPLVKVVVDLLRYHSLAWVSDPSSLVAGSSTLNVGVCVKGISFLQACLFAEGGIGFTPVDWLCGWLSDGVIIGTLVVMLVVAGWRIWGWGGQWRKGRRELARWVAGAREVERVDGRTELLFTDEGIVPSAFRLRGGKILVSRGIWEALTEEERRGVLSHELAHLRWLDDWVGCLVSLWSNLFWWIPGKGWWSRGICREREMACDAEARPGELAGALVRIARYRRSEVPLAVPLLGTSPLLEVRLRALMKRGRSRKIRNVVGIGCCLVVLTSKLWLF